MIDSFAQDIDFGSVAEAVREGIIWMEMSAQLLPTSLVGSNTGSERRSVGSARKRQRARELASSQLNLFLDFEVLEALATIRPPVGKVDVEPVYATPRLRVVPVYRESVDQPVADRVHYLDRTERQCRYPLWDDSERDLARHFMCGGPKALSATYCCSHMQLAYGKRAA